MAQSHRRFSDTFKRQAVERMIADPGNTLALADELGVARSLLYRWRKQYAHAPPLVSPSRSLERGPGGEVALGAGPEVRAEGSAAALDEHLRQTLRAAALEITHAIREATDGAPLNQLSAALGLILDRLIKLEALSPRPNLPVSEEVIRIEYIDPDGSTHASPPWARGDPAFEAPIQRGRVRSPFWEDRDGEADDSGDGPAWG